MRPAARRITPLGLLFLLGSSPGFTADLSVSSQVGGPGGSVVVAISFDAKGESVSGVQFDLVVDNSALTLAPVVGEATRSSGKTIYTAALSSNLTRILITELNQNSILDGSLVTLFVNIAPALSSNSYSIHVQSAFACDPLGNPISVTTEDGTITIVAADGASITPQGVLNGASLLPGAVAPGEMITIIGSEIASSALENTKVSFDDFPAPVLYSASNQINAAVPFEIDGQSRTNLTITGISGNPTLVSLAVAHTTPAIFTLTGVGTGHGAILNEDSSVNSPGNPAPVGSIIVLFATGAGQTDPAGADGLIATTVLPKPRLPVSVKIGGASADILYAGAAPGMIAGVLQVNCRIPAGVKSGNEVPVVLSAGDVDSPPVTLAVK